MVATAVVAALVSVLACYKARLAPAPTGTNDESSFLGEFYVKILMFGFVAICSVSGALLGWLIGYLLRALLPLPSQSRNI